MKKVKNVLRKAVLVFVTCIFLLYGVALVSTPPRLGKDCLPEALKTKRHSDYPKGLRWIPWSATSWCMENPPKKLLGTQKSVASTPAGKKGPKPVPEPGTWQLSGKRLHRKFPIYLPTYVAFTTKNKMHFRMGCRWDDVDNYYVFPSIALKKVR